MTLQTAALTLTSLERMLWVEERPLLSSLNPRLIPIISLTLYLLTYIHDFFREEDLVRYMVRLVAAFPSSYSKPPGSVNMRELLKKMKNFYKLKSLQVVVTFRKYFIWFFFSQTPSSSCLPFCARTSLMMWIR